MASQVALVVKRRAHRRPEPPQLPKSPLSAPTLVTWQPSRFPRPWDSPGKNTVVGCHFFLQCMKVKSESEVTQSCPTLSDPMDCRLPGSSVYLGFVPVEGGQCGQTRCTVWLGPFLEVPRNLDVIEGTWEERAALTPRPHLLEAPVLGSARLAIVWLTGHLLFQGSHQGHSRSLLLPGRER